jgi:hypothetical protein
MGRFRSGRRGPGERDRLVGQASDPAAAKRHVIKRASALGGLGLVSRLPADWGVREDASAGAELEIRA